MGFAKTNKGVARINKGIASTNNLISTTNKDTEATNKDTETSNEDKYFFHKDTEKIFILVEKIFELPKIAIKSFNSNKQRSSIRYIVERTFGLLKLHHGLRYLGIEKNKARAQLIAMSHNLKTGMNIFKQMRDLQHSCIQ
ncbi:MAG: hypothetical protein PSN36_06020 [Gammaproteobacteria bacterium]|nr:hypothetical protein [Gammaproteobacteria bacterium]